MKDLVASNSLLIKYWLEFTAPANHGLGIGVTAYSIEDAESLVSKMLFANGQIPAFRYRIIQNLDELEQNHVLPNIGLISFRGIWFPKHPPENY
ncbi:hypothetical protein ACFST9_16275 [Hymenobacter monticola]|uniref:Uncharacterized protein n=1 Tax=Hymenobacter monticola TaxID=1705399 RepID=A0ABY4B0P1_9BACT|nr:hypothetical protein [Hymenobacter monticola]UOE32535.1 hypothetical protein MTP16_15520 [Hymenobacter monticola]